MITHNNYSVYEYQIQYQNFGNEWGLFVDLENSYSNTNNTNNNTNNIIINKNDTTIDNMNKKYKYESKNKNKYYLYFISISTLFICSILNFSIIFLMIFIFSWFVYSVLFYLFALLEPSICI